MMNMTVSPFCLEEKVSKEMQEMYMQLIASETDYEICDAIAYYYQTLAFKLAKLINKDKFHRMAVQSLLPVYRKIQEDDTMMQNIVECIKDDCDFRCWEWDEYLAQVEKQNKRRKETLRLKNPDLPLFDDSDCPF